MSREPTEEMLKAGKEAYERKLIDMGSPSPTEEPGIGPLGYAYIAMFDADPDRCDAARLAAHCQSLIDIIDDVQTRCDEPVDDEDMVMVRHIEADATAALSPQPASTALVERLTNTLKAVREDILDYWLPDTAKGDSIKANMVLRIDAALDANGRLKKAGAT